MCFWLRLLFPQILMNRLLIASIVLPLLSGCSGFVRGVVQGILDYQSQEREDTRACAVDGVAFQGLAPLLERQRDFADINAMDPTRPTLKVIYVHGIGTQQLGHSAQLIEGLAGTLGLTVRSPRAKHVSLVSPDDPTVSLGELNVIRLTNPERSRDLIFYELTWSAINQPGRESIAFDSSQLHRSRRASINQAVRTFTNDVLPDPIAFAGSKGALIRAAASQALCWAISTTWRALPEETVGQTCKPGPSYGSRIDIDDYAIATHSLGSRIAMDALQTLPNRLSDRQFATQPSVGQLTERLKQKEITLFMLSNQLPLLEAGQEPQDITGKTAMFCGDSAPRSGERFFKSLHLVAFTDPNDVLSYPIPPSWAERYLDSRLCVRVTNVTINIAEVRNLFGLGEFADPLSAHKGYKSDERVRNLIARGAGHANVAPVVAERCTWTETDEALMH